MSQSNITGKDIFSNMSKEEFLKLLDDYCFKYIVREGGDTRPGCILYEDSGAVERYINGIQFAR